MSEFKGTRGPWRVSSSGDMVVTDKGSLKEMLKKAPVTVKRVCRCDNKNYMTREEVVANARLIAASPDLLAACLATLDEFKHLGQALGEQTPPEMVDVWNQVEAAVTKAIQ